MTKKFRELLKDFSPERIARIEVRKQELEKQMGVRRIDLTTDEVEYDSRDKAGVAIIPAWKYQDTEPQEFDEPRLEEHDWTNPLRPDKMEKIILDDETLAKLREAMEEYEKEQREKDQ